jgi:hypothetical protein
LVTEQTPISAGSAATHPEQAAEISPTITPEQVDMLMREALRGAQTYADHPWSWRSTGTLVELRSGLRAATDPQHRTVLLQAGAIVLNLRMLIRALGAQPAARFFPDPNRGDVVAIVRVEGLRAVTQNDRALAAAMLMRPGRTGMPGWVTSESISVAVMSELRRAARSEQGWLATHPASALPPTVLSPTGGGGHTGMAVIIGTVLDGPGARLQAGQAAQRVVLTAATLGVPLTPLPTAFTSDDGRRQVRQMLGGGLWPQVLLRLGSSPRIQAA